MAGGNEKIRIEGLRPFLKELREIDDKLPAEVKQINKDAAEDVVGVARGLVPRRDGTLLGSLKVGATQRSSTVKAGSRSVPYAGPIHFGWPRRNISPQPFLWDALDQRRDQITTDYERRLNALVDRVFPGGVGPGPPDLDVSG